MTTTAHGKYGISIAGTIVTVRGFVSDAGVFAGAGLQGGVHGHQRQERHQVRVDILWWRNPGVGGGDTDGRKVDKIGPSNYVGFKNAFVAVCVRITLS